MTYYRKWRVKCTEAVMLDPLASELEHYMDLLGKRQQLVAANIANADTPGYTTKDIDFQFEFMSQMEGGAPNVIDAPGLPVKNDGNNVNMERESRLLAENAVRFSIASSLLRDQIKSVRSAINEGK
jgi:flagellar basal-body rod protein FlgB